MKSFENFKTIKKSIIEYLTNKYDEQISEILDEIKNICEDTSEIDKICKKYLLKLNLEDFEFASTSKVSIEYILKNIHKNMELFEELMKNIKTDKDEDIKKQINAFNKL